jgi:hypothetical protein
MSAARRKRPPDNIYDRPVSTLPNLVVTFRSTMFLFALSTRSGIRHIWRRKKKEKQLLLKLLRCNMNVVVLDSTAWLQLSGTILVDSQLHVTTRSKKYDSAKTSPARVQSQDKEIFKESQIRCPPCVEVGLKHLRLAYMAYGSSKYLFDFLSYGCGLFWGLSFNS